MTSAERAIRRARYRKLLALRDCFQDLANQAKSEIWADEPDPFWRDVREVKEEVDTWPKWKIDHGREVLQFTGRHV